MVTKSSRHNQGSANSYDLRTKFVRERDREPERIFGHEFAQSPNVNGRKSWVYFKSTLNVKLAIRTHYQHLPSYENSMANGHISTN